MVRAAAKNHDDVAVVVDPADYAGWCSTSSPPTRRDHADAAPRGSPPRRSRTPRATTARSRTGSARQRDDGAEPDFRQPASAFASCRTCATARTRTSSAAFYRDRAGTRRRRRHRARSCRARSCRTTTSPTPTRPGSASASSTQRAAPASSSSTPIRAASPSAPSLRRGLRKALRTDPTSAFGGIIAFNRALDADTAREITKIFTEVIIAPDASEEAIAIIGGEEPSSVARRQPARSAHRWSHRKDRSAAVCSYRAATTRWSTT